MSGITLDKRCAQLLGEGLSAQRCLVQALRLNSCALKPPAVEALGTARRGASCPPPPQSRRLCDRSQLMGVAFGPGLPLARAMPCPLPTLLSAKSLRTSRIQVLTLRRNHLGPPSGPILGDLLAANPLLRRLDLRQNQLRVRSRSFCPCAHSLRPLTVSVLLFPGVFPNAVGGRRGRACRRLGHQPDLAVASAVQQRDPPSWAGSTRKQPASQQGPARVGPVVQPGGSSQRGTGQPHARCAAVHGPLANHCSGCWSV